jgi:hypothetical protein
MILVPVLHFWYHQVPSVWYHLFYHRWIEVYGRFLKTSIIVKLVS